MITLLTCPLCNKVNGKKNSSFPLWRTFWKSTLEIKNTKKLRSSFLIFRLKHLSKQSIWVLGWLIIGTPSILCDNYLRQFHRPCSFPFQPRPNAQNYKWIIVSGLNGIQMGDNPCLADNNAWLTTLTSQKGCRKHKAVQLSASPAIAGGRRCHQPVSFVTWSGRKIEANWGRWKEWLAMCLESCKKCNTIQTVPSSLFCSTKAWNLVGTCWEITVRSRWPIFRPATRTESDKRPVHSQTDTPCIQAAIFAADATKPGETTEGATRRHFMSSLPPWCETCGRDLQTKLIRRAVCSTTVSHLSPCGLYC